MAFDKSWEKNIYSKGKQLNLYPFDLLVSITARKFFVIPKEKRGEIKVLDLGCGGGNNAKFLAESGFEVYGIDGSETSIKICKKRFKEWGLKGRFICGDFSNLPFEDNFFDFVIDRESIYANSLGDIKKIIKDVHKKLKPSGYFFSFIYSNFDPDTNSGKMIEKNTYSNFSENSSFYKTNVAHFTDLDEISDLYANFLIENVMRHSLAEVFNKGKRFMEFDEYIIIAKKP